MEETASETISGRTPDNFILTCHWGAFFILRYQMFAIEIIAEFGKWKQKAGLYVQIQPRKFQLWETMGPNSRQIIVALSPVLSCRLYILLVICIGSEQSILW